MDRTKPDAAKFLSVDDELLDAMRQETRCSSAPSCSENRSILDFIDGRFTYLNGPLARYYGITGVDGEQFQRVELDGEQRSGIVTQGVDPRASRRTRRAPRRCFAASGCSTTCSAPRRRLRPTTFRRSRKRISARPRRCAQRLEQHRANPSCAAATTQMDPIGFGLENYDAAGAWRLKDGNFDVDSTGTLPDGRSFTGAKGLKQRPEGRRRTRLPHTFTEKLHDVRARPRTRALAIARRRSDQRAMSRGDNYQVLDAGDIHRQQPRRFRCASSEHESGRWHNRDDETTFPANRASRPGRHHRAAVSRRDVSGVCGAGGEESRSRANRMAFLYVPNGIVMETGRRPAALGSTPLGELPRISQRAGAVSATT